MRIAMLSCSRTRGASLSVALAFAIEDAPNVVSAKIEAIKHAEIFLNMVSPPQKELSLRGIRNQTVWVDIKMRIEALRLAMGTHASGVQSVSGRNDGTPEACLPLLMQLTHATRIARGWNTKQGVTTRGEPMIEDWSKFCE